jgi:hypothetical protein
VADDQPEEGGYFINRQRIDADFAEIQLNIAEGQYVQINWCGQFIGLLDRHNRAEIVDNMVRFLVSQGHFDPSVN